MAPEQVAADPAIDHRVDVYSFGATAYELLTRLPLFNASSPRAFLIAQMTEVPLPISAHRDGAPPALVEFVRSCLEKDPAARPQSAAAIVRTLDDIIQSGVSGVQTHVSPSASAGRPAALIGLISLMIAATMGAAMWYAKSRNHNEDNNNGANRSAIAPSTNAGTAGSAGATLNSKSLAVLPLTNLGRASTEDYFSDGMTDGLTSALSKVPQLRVASRTSAFAVKNKSLDTQQIGAILNVASILEGTVRRAGSRRRVAVRLVNAQDGIVLWSDTYERGAKDVFAVQDDITDKIVGALKVTMGANPASSPRSQAGTQDLRAYDSRSPGAYPTQSQKCARPSASTHSPP